MLRNLGTAAIVVVLAASTWAVADIGVYDDTYVFHPEGGEGDYSAGTAYLGIDSRDVTPERMAALKLKEERGAEITMVDQDAPAGKVGLKEHDVILEMNGQKVEGVEQLHRMIKETPPGRTVSLLLSRDGQPLTVNVTLADRRKALAFEQKMWKLHPEQQHVMPLMPPMPAMPVIDIPSIDVNVRTYSNTGIVIESLSPQLGEYFGVKNGDGVLVRSVEKGSPADKAGLRAGDVIIRVDTERITDRGDWRSAMRSHRGGKVTLGIVRDRREQSVTLTLPEAKDGDNSFRFEWPDLDFEGMSRELEQLGPEIQKATHDAMLISRDQIDRAVRQAQLQMASEMKKLHRELENSRREMEKAARESQKKTGNMD